MFIILQVLHPLVFLSRIPPAAKKSMASPAPPSPVVLEEDNDEFKPVHKKRAANVIQAVGVVDEVINQGEVTKQYELQSLSNSLSMTNSRSC